MKNEINKQKINRQKIKKRVFEIIEKAKKGDFESALFDWMMILLIVLNVVAIIAASFQNISRDYALALRIIELISVVIFTLEYFLRIWTADLMYKNEKHPHIRYFRSFMAIVDLISILPFYLPFVMKFDFRMLRLLRLFNLMRVFKLNHYNNAMTTIAKVFKHEKDSLIMTVFIISIMLLFSSSVMYYVENAAQPEQFPNILASLWWAVATLTTVGYGDIYPITVVGKLFSGIIALLGIGLLALPTAIISSGFFAELNSNQEKKKNNAKYCPHCGKKLE